ncbi:MAG TPA: GNAT family N-acetyltransferase [Polyangiaceae bacterium]|nr:GNAT family N-acetyltransferase [Polyangiaceae bacterium]
MITPILNTTRLVLRPLRATDEARLQALFPHYEVLKYMNAAIPWPYPDDGATHFIESALAGMAREERFVWAIVEKAAGDDLLIGCIDLFPTKTDDNRGFWLGLPYQGKGYMTEAVAAVTDFAFDVVRLPRLVLNNAEPNLASHRLKEKAGAMILEINEAVHCVGGVFRQIRWIHTPEQWHANRNRFLNSSA